MPIYEYNCRACRRRVSLFFRSFAHVDEYPACPHCGEQALHRRMSRVWSHAPARDDAFVDEPTWTTVRPAWSDPLDSGADWGDDDLDAATFARHARQMAELSGDPIDAEFDRALHHVEAGADPEDVFGELDARATDSDNPDS